MGQHPAPELLNYSCLQRVAVVQLSERSGVQQGNPTATTLWACQLLAVLLLICIVWHAVFCVKIVVRRRVRLPCSVLGPFHTSVSLPRHSALAREAGSLRILETLLPYISDFPLD